MLARTRDLTEKILGWYEAFEFHRVYQAVNEFAVVDLSAFYLDVLKDRMYTFAPTSLARRSAQTVLWQITEALVRLVAPILTFTADEVWEHLPPVAGREASVHLARFPKPQEIFSEDPARLIEEWKQLFAVRDEAMRVLEEDRQAKIIGKGLEAQLRIETSGPLLVLLKRYEDGLKEIPERFARRGRGRQRAEDHGLARAGAQVRSLLELHARSLRLRHLEERLHAMPIGAPGDGHRAAQRPVMKVRF